MKRLCFLACLLIVTALGAALGGGVASADSYFPITGEGSSWSANAIQQWISDVQQYGMQVNFTPNGSTTGRQDWLKGLADFAASDIPFQSNPQDGSAPESPAAGTYAYMPITSGGTAFMYNLKIAGRRVTNLRLSGSNLAKIFGGSITNWDDPALKSDNPELNLPNQPIVPVVRSDGSGSSFTLSQWMISQYPASWNALCTKSGRPASECGATSFWPTVSGMVAQSGDAGVSGYVAASYANGAIGYVNYSYALQKGFPVVKMLNAAGYYTQPTPFNVAVSLLAAKVDTSDVNNPSLYLTQQLGGVYNDSDPRSYPLSMYSYLILPTRTSSSFSQAKGKTLAAFAYYAMCQGQQEAMSPTLGYSPLPINLVEDAFTQIRKIPGAVVQNINVGGCNNPTFSSSGANRLAQIAPMPPACDKQGATQCTTGTGGAAQSTPVSSSIIVVNPKVAGSTNSGAPTGSQASGAGSTRSPSTGGSAQTHSSGGSSTGSPTAQSSQQSGSGQGCSASTSDCSGSAASGSAQASQAEQAAVVTSTVKGPHGWTSTQSVMLLVGLLVLGVILAPGLASRFVSKKDS